MARGKARTNIIEVKESNKHFINCSGVMNLQEILKESRNKACEREMSEKLAKMSPEELKLVSSSLATAHKEVDQCSAMKQATPEIVEFNEAMLNQLEETTENAAEALEQNLVISDQTFNHDGLLKKDKFIEVKLNQTEETADTNAVDESLLEPNIVVVGQTDKKKKKKKKKKDNKKNTKKSHVDIDVSEAEKFEADTEVKGPIRLAPIKKKGSTKEQDSKAEEARVDRKVGCIGFISSWWVKRKEKKRAKKRKAIEARQGRQSKNGENLVVYGNKRARGGVAFTVELDSRPIDRSVLPPIAKRPGPIRMATEQKLENAENKREQQLDKKREAARAHSRLVREAADRRTQNEEEYKQKTHEKVYRKHSKAAENKYVNKKIETARAHSRLVRETAEKRAKCDAEFKQATLYKILLKDQKTSNLLQRAREEQRSRCASRCATRCASRMDSARGTNADCDTFLDKN